MIFAKDVSSSFRKKKLNIFNEITKTITFVLFTNQMQRTASQTDRIPHVEGKLEYTVRVHKHHNGYTLETFNTITLGMNKLNKIRNCSSANNDRTYNVQ